MVETLNKAETQDSLVICLIIGIERNRKRRMIIIAPTGQLGKRKKDHGGKATIKHLIEIQSIHGSMMAGEDTMKLQLIQTNQHFGSHRRIQIQ